MALIKRLLDHLGFNRSFATSALHAVMKVVNQMSLFNPDFQFGGLRIKTVVGPTLIRAPKKA